MWSVKCFILLEEMMCEIYIYIYFFFFFYIGRLVADLYEFVL